MQYRSLGRTGVQVSVLGLGTENFGPRTPEADACALVDAALDRGVNLMDTANFYGTEDPDDYSERRGQSEVILGRALKRNGRRHDVIVATKGRGPMWRGPNGESASRLHLLRAAEDSLRRLQTDYLDLYQVHWPDAQVPIDETLRALDDLVRSGKVRYLGTSSFHAWQIMEGLWASDRLGLNRFVSEQALYNLTQRLAERELLPMLARHGLGLLVWSPLFAGVLTGKYQRGQPLPAGSRLADDLSERNWPRRYLGDRVHDLLDGLKPLAAEKGCSLAQFAIAWLLAQPAVTSALMGPRTREQMDEYLGALAVTLTDEDLKRVDALVKPRTSVLQ
jgi:aryl-alcohol dehydrogenase-like predicted oxidoreductase